MNTVTVGFISIQMINTVQPLRVLSDKGLFFYIRHDKTNRKAPTNQPVFVLQMSKPNVLQTLSLASEVIMG